MADRVARSWLTLWMALIAPWVLLIWPFAVEKTDEEDVAEQGWEASVLMVLWALEERLEEGS